MLVTLSGIVIDVKPVQLSNAYPPMLVTSEPIITLFMLGHDQLTSNKYAGIFSTLSPNVTVNSNLPPEFSLYFLIMFLKSSVLCDRIDTFISYV